MAVATVPRGSHAGGCGGGGRDSRALGRPGVVRPLPGAARGAAPHHARGRCQPGGQRHRAAGDARGRTGAAVRARQGIAASAADQHVRDAPAHVVGAGRRRSGRTRALDLRPGQVAAADRPDGQAAHVAEAGARRVGHAEDRAHRALPAGRRDRRRPRQAAGAHDLAGRRRAVHHAADGHHARSRQGDAQRRLLPDAGLRPAHDRHALAAAQDRAAAHAPLQGAGAAAHAGGGRARRRSGAALRGDGAAARRHRRVHVRGVPAPQAGRDGALQDHRSRGAGVGRLRAGRLRRRRRAAPRGAVRRSHRLLLAGRRLPGLPHHGDHAARGADLRDHRGRAAAAGRRLAGQGDRAAVSCRCCR